MLKKILLFSLTISAVAALAGFPQKKNVSSGKLLPVNGITVVPEEKNQLAGFAAEELVRVLNRSGNPAVRSDKPGKGFNILLGNSAAARAKGMDVQTLPPDGFRIFKEGNTLYIAGHDTPSGSPFKDSGTTGWGYAKGTLYGVYELLERFADVRFYFPGEMGTLIPRKKLLLPEKIDLIDYPAWIERSYLSPWSSGGRWYPAEPDYKRKPSPSLLSTLRFRAKFIIPKMSNALQYGDYIRRFRTSHPEYFAVDPSGKIIADIRHRHRTQLCLSSGIQEEIYQDIKAYFTGKAAASRGMQKWDNRMFLPGYVNFTHDDSFVWCACSKCRKTAEEVNIRNNPAEQQKVSNAVWKFTCDIAARLKKEGIAGKIIMLAYDPYSLVPECDIPDNVLPVVAVFPGPQGDTPMRRRNDELLKKWQKKTGGKILVRTWPGKYMTRAIPGVPAFKHNYVGQYFSERKNWFSGAYMDEMSDYQIFRVLNLYVFMKQAWNPDCDWKAIIDEYFQRMFGSGASFIRKYYDEMEQIWDHELIRGTTSTNYGGRDIVAQYHEIWTDIFTAKRMETFAGYFDSAEKATRNEPDAQKRIRFMRTQIFDPLREQWQSYQVNQNTLDTWQAPVPGKIHLRARSGRDNEVNTVVSISETNDSFLFEAECEEPRMDLIRADEKDNDSGKAWQDSTFEVFLNPSGDRENYYQWVINANGALDDYALLVNGLSQGVSWNSHAVATVKKTAEGWNCRLVIPKSALGNYVKDGFPAIFARRRVLKQKGLAKEEYYYWCPLNGGKLMEPDKWGLLLLNPEKSAEKKNLYPDGGFSTLDLVKRDRRIYTKLNSEKQQVSLDHRSFIRDGRSLRLSSQVNENMIVYLPFPGLLPGKKYKISFFCRLKNVQGKGLNVRLYCGPGKGIKFMSRCMNGNLDWHRLVYKINIPEDFPAGRNSVIITLHNATGDVWIDNLRIEEL